MNRRTPSEAALQSERKASTERLPMQSRPQSDVKYPASPAMSNLSQRNSFARAGAMITSPSKSQINSLTVVRNLGPQITSSPQDYQPEDDERNIEANPGKFLGNLVNTAYKQTSDWRRSSLPRVGFGGVEKSHYDYNPLYTSPDFRKSRVNPLAPPTDLVRAVCAIYTIGYGFDSGTHSYGRPNGLGFLVNEILLITAHSVIPDEDSAISSYAQFRDGEVFNFDPYLCFATSKKYEFTILAFKENHSRTALRYFIPLQITQLFTLKTNASVNFLPHNQYSSKSVVIVEKDCFTVQSSKPDSILPGTPFFDNKWTPQGMYIKTVNKIHIAVRFEPILAYLSANSELQHNELLSRYLNAGSTNFIDKFHSRFIYFFEWDGKKSWRYDIDREAWEEVSIRNYEHISKQQPDWSFHWGARLAYLKSGSILLIGGRDKAFGRETDEVWMFSPQKYHIMSKLSPMGNVRDSCVAVVVEDKYVYVLGGKPHLDSCERYSISSNSWQPIASMFYGRYEAAACTALESRFIFVFGGQPLNLAGATVERYNTEMNHWELLGVTLPRSLYRLSVFPITNRRIAVLGGNGSHWVYVMYMERSIAMVNLAIGGDSQDFYVIKDGQRNLDEPVESVYPVAFDRSRNRLYLLNMARQSQSSQVPAVTTYNVEYFDYTERVDYSEKPVEIPVAPFSLQRTGFDTYYM